MAAIVVQNSTRAGAHRQRLLKKRALNQHRSRAWVSAEKMSTNLVEKTVSYCTIHASFSTGLPALVVPEYSYHARRTSIRVSRDLTSGIKHQAERVTTVSVAAFGVLISIPPGALSTTWSPT